MMKPRMDTPEYEEYLRERRCGHKVPYTAEPVARNAAILLSWVSEEFRGLEPYYCKYCTYFHLGHPYFRMSALGFVKDEAS